MSIQAVSNQLKRLAEASVVDGHRDGLQIYYRVIDPCVQVLLERGWCHIEEFEGRGSLHSLTEAEDLADQLEPV